MHNKLSTFIPGFLLLIFAGHASGQHRIVFDFPAPEPGYAVGSQVAGDSRGRILIAGSDRNIHRTYDGYITDEYALWRYLPDGTPDTSFGKKGQVFRRIGDKTAGIITMKVLPDDRILTMGYFQRQLRKGFLVGRHLPDGAWDTRFGEDGMAYFDMDNAETELRLGRMLALPDGKVLISGYEKTRSDGGHEFFLYQLLPDGRRDSSFGTFGEVRLPVENDEFVPGLARDEKGNILVAGSQRVSKPGYKYVVILRRFLPDGQLDASFADQGTRIFEETSESYLIRDMVFTPEGRILLTGGCNYGDGTDVFLLEVDPSLPVPRHLRECNLQVFNIGKQPYREHVIGLLLLKSGEVLLYGCTGEKSTENYYLALRDKGLTADESFGENGVYIEPWWNIGFFNKITHAAIIGKRLYFAGAMPRKTEFDPNCVFGIGIDWPLKK